MIQHIVYPAGQKINMKALKKRPALEQGRPVEFKKYQRSVIPRLRLKVASELSV